MGSLRAANADASLLFVVFVVVFVVVVVVFIVVVLSSLSLPPPSAPPPARTPPRKLMAARATSFLPPARLLSTTSMSSDHPSSKPSILAMRSNWECMSLDMPARQTTTVSSHCFCSVLREWCTTRRTCSPLDRPSSADSASSLLEVTLIWNEYLNRGNSLPHRHASQRPADRRLPWAATIAKRERAPLFRTSGRASLEILNSAS